MFIVRVLAFVLISVATAGVAHGAETSPWTTTSHLGLAVVDRSSTGFDKSMGSLVFLDVEREVTARMAIGARTLAQGAKLDGRAFYRLGAGPLVTYRIFDGWVLHLAAARFDETGKNSDDANEYKSSGTTTQVGWERVFRYGSKVELAWGGFVIAHEGGVTLQPAAVGSTALSSRHNSGLSHGVEAALRIDL